MTALTLTEYKCREAVPLSDEARDALRRLVPTVKVAPTVGIPKHYDLTPSHVVGSVHTDDLDLVIRPKLPVSRVMFMLSYALRPDEWREWRERGVPFSYEQTDSIVEAVIPSYVWHVGNAIGRGVLHGYRERDETLQTVRGRIRFADQIRRQYGRCVPAEVRFDDYTADIDENRILKAALHRLQRIGIRALDNRKRLKGYTHALSDVSQIEYPNDVAPQITYTRLNQHYRPAVELARLILRSSSFDFSHGRVTGTTFLFDMNAVFENFVVTALRDALQLSDRVFVQGGRGKRINLDAENRVRLQPDISWWDGPVCRFVGDVKYKAVSVAGMKNADLYQLLAYTVATQLDDGLLIYARGEGEPMTYAIPLAGKRLHVAALDLEGSPQDILQEIEKLAVEVRQYYVRSDVSQVA